MRDIERIAKVIKEAVWECGLANEPQAANPPPADLKAERDLLGGFLSGEITLSDYPRLQDKHFFHRLNFWIFEQLHAANELGRKLSTDQVVDSGLKYGYASSFMRPEIQALHERPCMIPRYANESIDILIELYQARKLIEQIGHVNIALRTGSRKVKSAKAYLQGCIA